MITAVKNGLQRNFSERQWGNMPRDKFGWTPIGEQNAIQTQTGSIKPDEIIQIKIVSGKVADVAAKKTKIPDELKPSK